LTTTILLVRHGQTDWNLAHRWQGHIDIPLNETGRRQARLLAQRLETLPIKAIYSSDLIRASETARIIAEPLDVLPVTDPALRERNGGKFQSLTFDELQEQYPEMWRKVRLENATPPDGESLFEVACRITAAYEVIVRRHTGQLVVMVSHGGALNLLIATIVGLPLGKSASISLRGNTGLSIVEIGDNGAWLVALNDTHHLHSASEPDLEQALPSPAEAS
jgi:broad specificity phosphatase PhoE